MHRLLLALFVSIPLFGTAYADGLGILQLESGERKVALIELYTSEGCSSCPPADRWLSDLKSDERLWKDYVPIALHVDYWNYIGWTDRFSKSSYTDRQRKYVQDGGAGVVYTPGFFNNGEEWRGWFRDRDLEIERPSIGNLSLRLDGDALAVRFDPVFALDGPLVVNIAVLGMQLESDVQAGENEGKILKHDFVALDIQTIDMQSSAGGFMAIAGIDDAVAETSNLSLVAWVTEKGDQTPLQSVGGYLP